MLAQSTSKKKLKGIISLKWQDGWALKPGTPPTRIFSSLDCGLQNRKQQIIKLSISTCNSTQYLINRASWSCRRVGTDAMPLSRQWTEMVFSSIKQSVVTYKDDTKYSGAAKSFFSSSHNGSVQQISKSSLTVSAGEHVAYSAIL